MKKYCFLILVFAFIWYMPYAAATPKIIPEAEIARWNYKTVQVSKGKQHDWEKLQFGRAKIKTQRIKAKFEVPNWPKAYYRFTISEETYASPEKAKIRLQRLFDTPPDVNTKMEPEFVLRKGIQDGKKVIIISTDVKMFSYKELPKIFEKVEKFLKERE